MLEFKTVISHNGRVLIPAKCREALHLSPGETLIIRVKGDEATMCSAKTAIAQAQNMVTKVMKGKKTLVDELIKVRRRESDHE